MQQRSRDKAPTSELTSMVDIIFQLLIFFMVTLALGTVNQRATAAVKGEKKEDLPKLPPVERLGAPPEFTDGYLLHIDKKKKGREKKIKGDLIAYILDPDVPTPEDARKDSSGGHGPFSLDMGKRKLKKLIESRIALGEEPPPLEIRANEKTPYGYILDIMEFCNEDSIEVVNFHFANVKSTMTFTK